MALISRNSKLSEKISLYKKEDLKNYASDLGIRGYSKMKKEELAKAVLEKLLAPETMFYRMAILDKKQIGAFERGIGDFREVEKEDSNAIGLLNELDLAIVGSGVYLVPQDVAEVWQKINNEKFENYREKANWVWKCLFWTEEMYACTTYEAFLNVVNCRKGMNISEAELVEIFDHFPVDKLWSVRLDEVFLSCIYADNMDALYDLRVQQADKPFYIPKEAEVEELNETGALLSIPEYRNMRRFMEKELRMSSRDVEDILVDLWEKIAWDGDMHEAMQWFWNQFAALEKKDAERLVNLYSPLANNTRMLVNRGNTPMELAARMKLEPGKKPKIMAGSSDMAKMLAEATPQIKKIGFDIDLEGNAMDIPVVAMPQGVDGPVNVSSRKVYPNDPCPCGSGKKFKKCCGRNKENV